MILFLKIGRNEKNVINQKQHILNWSYRQCFGLHYECNILASVSDRMGEYWSLYYTVHHRHLYDSDSIDNSTAEIFQIVCKDESGAAGNSEKI